MVKNLPANAGDAPSILELGRSPGERNGNRLQYSCLGNAMDRVAYSPWGCKELDMTRCTLCLKKVQFYYISLGTSRSIYYMNDYLVLCSEQSITYKIFKVYLPSIWNNTLSSHSLNMQTLIQFSSVESLNRVRLFVTPLTARPPFPSPTPGVYTNSCPLSW